MMPITIPISTANSVICRVTPSPCSSDFQRSLFIKFRINWLRRLSYVWYKPVLNIFEKTQIFHPFLKARRIKYNMPKTGASSCEGVPVQIFLFSLRGDIFVYNLLNSSIRRQLTENFIQLLEQFGIGFIHRDGIILLHIFRA